MIADQKGVSAQSTKEIEKGSASAAKLSYEPIPPRAKSVRVKDGKIQIEIFVSYARKDKDRVKKLLEELKPRLQLKLEGLALDLGCEINFLRIEAQKKNEGVKVRLWRDEEELLPGDDFVEEIRKALKRSTLGLFMVSPHSLTSSFIRKEELSPLLKEKKLFPVGLVKFVMTP